MRLQNASARSGGWHREGLGALAQMSGIKEIAEDATADQMVAHLLEAHQKVLSDVAIVREKAGEAKDLATEDMMIGRKQVHQKAVWMLTSYLG